MTIVFDDVYNCVLDPAEEAESGRSQLFLQAAGSGIAIEQQGIDWGDAAVQSYMADALYGSSPVDMRIPNRTVSIPLGIGMNEADDYSDQASWLRQKIALFQNEGGVIKRGDNMYADIVGATLNIPDRWGETAGVEDQVKLVLDCRPDFYGVEIDLDVMNGANGYLLSPLLLNGLPARIQGEVPGRLRLTVQEMAFQDQRAIRWGIRSRYYDSDPMAALHYAGSALALDASASLVSGIPRSAVLPNGTWQPFVWMNTPLDVFRHIGAYRVLARVRQNSGASPAMVRLMWDLGDFTSPHANDWCVLPSSVIGSWVIADLGTVLLPKTPVSPQAWTGRIDAASSVTGGETIDLYEVFLQPLDDGYGYIHSNPDYAADVAIGAATATEVRWDGAWRSASIGYKPVSYRLGPYPRVPPSRLEGRVSELLVKLSRGITQSLVSIVEGDPGLDSFTVQPSYRPCYLGRP